MTVTFYFLGIFLEERKKIPIATLMERCKEKLLFSSVEEVEVIVSNLMFGP